MIRLAVARAWFCSNSFNPRRTRLEDVRRHEWTEGPAAFSRALEPRSDFDGVAAFLAARPDWEAVALRCASAPAGGPLAAEVPAAWLWDVELALRRARFDGLYLSLNGACQAEGDPNCGLSLLRRLRAVARRLPIVASFASVANISDEVPLLLDGASAARGPADGAAAAARALGLLEGILAGRTRPVGAVARVPVVVPPERMQRTLQGAWQDELPSPLLDASVFSGFAWADSPWTGPSALVWADRDAGVAREAAAALALRLTRGRERGPGRISHPPELAIAMAGAQGRTLVLDPADDPELGGIGDTPEILRAALACDRPGTALGVLADPRAVAAARLAGEGAELVQPLGACLTPAFGPPVTARLSVVRVLEEIAVLRAGEVSLLVAERPMVAAPALFAAAGIDLGALDVLVLKGGEWARMTFARPFPAAIAADCPGPTSHDLAGLPYSLVPPARLAAAARASGDQRRSNAEQQWA
jgi:microcystin degradation protein MlrC